jgi:16S rRNA (cytosine967-C5)-methyltransferase
MDANRKTAYNTLIDVETKKSYSNIALNHQIICGKPDNASFVRELVYGVLENKMLLDYVIDSLVPSGVSKIKTSDLIILRMGIYQLAKMDSVPEYAAVNESVILAKKFARGRENFINGVLRSYIRDKYKIKLPDRNEDEIKYLSVKYSYEPWIIKLWLESYDTGFVEELLKAGNESPDITIRMNWLKVMKEDLVKNLEKNGYTVKEGRHSKNALHIKGKDLLSTQFYKNGMFSVQDEASQMVAQILDPRHGETIMDVCAAPGGKTLAIAERMNNKGIVLASDIYRRKLDIINRETERLGINIVETRTWDATKVDSSMLGKADRVVVDAPCSALGVIRRKPEIKYKKETAEIQALPGKQLAILSASASYVKPGGKLMYCTCTINPYENERVISDFIRKIPSFIVEQTVQFLPNVDDTDGFYICLMKKTDDLFE